MTVLNQKYLIELLKKYNVETVNPLTTDFSTYCVSNKKCTTYLSVCNDYDATIDINAVLNSVSVLESSKRNGNSYLCIVPKKRQTLEMCTHCNGKSFVHFIFVDINTKTLLYDKHIYYLGSKHVKQMMQIFRCCFCEQQK